MKIALFKSSLLIGGTVTIILIASAYFLYRFYKRVGRRCRNKECGSIWRPRRFNKIYLAPDETFSLRNKNSKWRWWIRRVSTETFVECSKCGHIELVKYTGGPISVWHAWWVRRFDPDQYEIGGRIATISRFAYMSHTSGKGLEPESPTSRRADIPPLKLTE